MFPREFGDHCTPLDASGADGLTDGKGCYPGQEVIERTIALGRPARALVSVESESPLHAGAALSADGATVGTITSGVEYSESSWLGLALVKSRAADRDAFTVDDHPVRRRTTEG